MDNLYIVALLGLTCGLIIAYFVARKSEARRPLKGGLPARIFHYLGAAFLVAVGPMILIGGIGFRLQFAQSASLCFGFLAFGFMMLMVHAFFELQSGKV